MTDERQAPSQQGSDPQPEFGWRYLAWLLAALFILGVWQASRPGSGGMEEISYTQFKQQVQQDRVESVTIRGDQVTGRYHADETSQARPEDGAETAPAQPPAPERFSTTLPSVDDPGLMPLLESHEVTIHAESAQRSWWLQLVIGLLPWLLIFGVLVFVMYRFQQRMQGSAQGMFGFGKSRARRFSSSSSDVTFDRVAGLNNAKLDLQEIIGYLRDPQRYRRLGAKVPRGMLLVGPPGTGKTLLARAVAGEAEVPFFSISASEFIEMFVGIGASRVRDMFDSAKKEAPAIIFIDELDAIGRTRGAGVGGGHDEREQTLNQILSEMDGFQPHEAVVVLAATNRPDVLDSALMRPGRFDRKVMLEMPERDARRRILEVHTGSVPLADDVDLDTLAGRTIGFSGADLENLVNEAALLAAREDREQVDMATFDQAHDKIVLGNERESRISDEERRLIAWHESGHALAAWLLPYADPLDKVTIIPRGQALGATRQQPEEDRHNISRACLYDRIAVMLGGRVAERIVFEDISSGAEQDLKQATRLAQRMVSEWGMSEELGSVAYRQGEEHVFLGQEISQPRDYSESTAERIDREVQRLIRDTEQRVEDLLSEHRDQLETIAETLLAEETLERGRLEEILDQPSGAAGDRAQARQGAG